MSDEDVPDVSRRQKIDALIDVAKFNPKLTVGIVFLGIAAAMFEGFGLGFILPIVEIVQAEGDPAAQADGVMAVFVTVYEILGIPFTLGFVVLGVIAVMTIRYSMSFGVAWLREALRNYYIRDLQDRAFNNALGAKVEYYDEEGSDDILNAIITQTNYAGRVIMRCVTFLEQTFLSLVYFTVALVISPTLTIFAAVVLGGFTVLIRNVLEPGYELGNKVADANEDRQEAAQAGTQGIRDIRMFGVAQELYDDFVDAIDSFTKYQIKLRRNEAAISNFYNLMVVVSVFALVFLALTFADLSIGALAVFLFAMFRLGPRVSNLNRKFYRIENELPHLVRTIDFMEELEQYEEPNEPTAEVPQEVKHVEFEEVWFSYGEDEQVLRGINFELKKGEFIAFVGQSGAGKSTIISLLGRMYEVNNGKITANGIPISEMDLDEWRDRIAMVRQSPFIFNDTLRYNLTIGNREASQCEIDKVCEIAKVDEFIDELPQRYDTMLGDEGVRLSGGQKQRVALARALLKDADLLVLDEATSDLDSNLEKEVQRAIEEMERDYAIISIAHRLSTVQNADRIYTVDDGKIIESGRHEELINDGALYAELYAIQSNNA